MEKAVKQGAVFKEEVPEPFVNGEDTVAMCGIDELKGHRSRALHGVQIPTGGAETAFTAERDKLKFSAVGTAIHGPAKGRIAAVYHFFNIFYDRVTGMKNINHFFIMVSKNIL